jgi:hypothetical protein
MLTEFDKRVSNKNKKARFNIGITEACTEPRKLILLNIEILSKI